MLYNSVYFHKISYKIETRLLYKIMSFLLELISLLLTFCLLLKTQPSTAFESEFLKHINKENQVSQVDIAARICFVYEEINVYISFILWTCIFNRFNSYNVRTHFYPYILQESILSEEQAKIFICWWSSLSKTLPSPWVRPQGRRKKYP